MIESLSPFLAASATAGVADAALLKHLFPIEAM